MSLTNEKALRSVLQLPPLTIVRVQSGDTIDSDLLGPASWLYGGLNYAGPTEVTTTAQLVLLNLNLEQTRNLNLSIEQSIERNLRIERTRSIDMELS